MKLFSYVLVALTIKLTVFAQFEWEGKTYILPSKLYNKLKLKSENNDIKSYKESLSKDGLIFDMVAIPGGEFERGGVEPNSKPIREISISTFWMSKYEITWKQYERWRDNLDTEQWTERIQELSPEKELISRPTPPFMDMSFGMGKKNRPVTGVTHFAARSFCMWLSARTGHFYRLPTEAEWEYACRAGQVGKYSYGEDKSKLKDYAWYLDNSGGKYNEVGKKKPNAWGLHDMHGNVAEWVLDSYVPNFYAKGAKVDPLAGPIKNSDSNPFKEADWPNKIYGRIVRGGSWMDPAEKLTSSYRVLSEKKWKVLDPQIPKSVWYHTSAAFIGFRVVRAAKIPSLEELHKYWPSDEEMKAIPPR